MTHCLSPSNPSRHHDSLSVSVWSVTSSWLIVCLLIHHVIMTRCLYPDPSRHHDSLSVSVWSITSSWLVVCLRLIRHVIMTHCLSPSDPSRHHDSLSVSWSITSSWLIVCLRLIHHVIMTHCLSPSDPSRHYMSFVSICVTDPGGSDWARSVTLKSSDEGESEKPVDSFRHSIHWVTCRLKPNWSCQWNTQWWVSGRGRDREEKQKRRYQTLKREWLLAF